MGMEYALVHLKYTIPPALLLTFISRPLLHSIDVYKIVFLIIIAVVSTIPWDSYLIRNGIWTYPEHVILGPCLLLIPFEELFFFVIQTYNTSLFYILLSKFTLHPTYLKNGSEDSELRRVRNIVCVIITSVIAIAATQVSQGGQGLYMGLIFIWAGPFILLLWTLSYQFVLKLPLRNTLLPVALPTLYLWIVDTFALQRGTWVISSGTKLDVKVWTALEIEEAVFFMVTNVLIVFGLLAFDNALAILYIFPKSFPVVPTLPSPSLLIKALIMDKQLFDIERVEALRDAVFTLSSKSRSFSLASAAFQGRLRIDLILLYAFCRVADDLVDDSASRKAAQQEVEKLQMFLNLAKSESLNLDASESNSMRQYVQKSFPRNVRSAFLFLPTGLLDYEHLQKLVDGFVFDLNFDKDDKSFPVNNNESLTEYAQCVAGTVAMMCVSLIFAHCSQTVGKSHKEEILSQSAQMGRALQFVNIARDIQVDARMSRLYIPTAWLEDSGISASIFLKTLPRELTIQYRNKLISMAMVMYDRSLYAVDKLPRDTRSPIRLAIENYMEIGRALKELSDTHKSDAFLYQATVPRARRLLVAWKALNS